MTETFRIFFLIILLTISLASYFLVISAFFVKRVSKTQNVINQTPGRSFGLGLVNFLFFSAIIFALFAIAENTGNFVKGLLTVPAFIILAFLISLLSIGLTAMVKVMSERMFPDLTAWKQMLWGSVILCFACALPFVGWFLLIPYVMFIGIGATILGFLQKS